MYMGMRTNVYEYICTCVYEYVSKYIQYSCTSTSIQVNENMDNAYSVLQKYTVTSFSEDDYTQKYLEYLQDS